MYQAPVFQKRISDVIAEYEEKVAAVEAEIAAFEEAATRLKTAACVNGTWGNVSINTGTVYEDTIKDSLLKSAWMHVYKGLNIDTIAPASDKSRFEQAMANPPPFTLDNIRATFGDYVADPFGNILRGLAEVFCTLDPAYKSHDKVKIGVAGLPKRVIIGNVGGYSGWGKDRIRDIINALAAYQGKPLMTWAELDQLMKDGDSLYHTRGVTLTRFKNGNGHLHFDAQALRDINRALAAYYGDVLPDCHEETPEKKQQSTAVSKDLQYYPTPEEVVEILLDELPYLDRALVLEPSCGCGRIMDGLKKRGAIPFGIEVDPARAEQCRRKGHAVLTANFLETVPTPKYDHVVMNPPFYGTHYAKHVKHALKFLKPGGRLTAILPATARYDHGQLDGRWQDLPLGSFKKSGTNINTSILTIYE